MKRLTRSQDAYGCILFDYHSGKDPYEVVERDDGFVGLSRASRGYLAEHKKWPLPQRQAIRLARGRALDVGCGAGRVCLYLQQRGLDVVGVDTSPLAIRVCRLKGVRDARVMSITELGSHLGTFDTIVMYGNNFGLFGNPKRARWLLKRFHAMASDRARILAESKDPYRTDAPCHRAYHRRSRARGRLAGQLRIRVRYQVYATPWFDYLLVSKGEMRAILDGTGWTVSRFYDSGGSTYVAVIEKER